MGRPDPARDLSVIEEMQDRLRVIEASPLRAAAGRAATTEAAAREAGLDHPDHDACVDAARALVSALDALQGSLHRFKRLAGQPVALDLPDLPDALGTLRRDTGRLQDWLHWRGLVAEARGLGPLATALEQGEIEDAVAAFERAYAA